MMCRKYAAGISQTTFRKLGSVMIGTVFLGCCASGEIICVPPAVGCCRPWAPCSLAWGSFGLTCEGPGRRLAAINYYRDRNRRQACGGGRRPRSRSPPPLGCCNETPPVRNGRGCFVFRCISVRGIQHAEALDGVGALKRGQRLCRFSVPAWTASGSGRGIGMDRGTCG